jgi:small subunit ribosomal protein S14
MARKSVIARELKRQKIVFANQEKRAYLSSRRSDVNLTHEERQEAQLLLQKMSRDSSASRLRNRCVLTGRPRGVFKRFNLSRTQIREQAMLGNVPGLKKASW